MLRFAVASTRKRRLRQPKTEVFENTLQSGDFRKRRFRVNECGRVKASVFENDDEMIGSSQ